MKPKQLRPGDLSMYNEHGALKTPKLLVVSLVFLCRYPISLALGALSTLVLSRRGLELGTLGFPPLDGLVASIPPLGLLVLVLLGEKATRFSAMRHLLRYGVAIALIACMLQMLAIARIFWMDGLEVLDRVVFEGVLLSYCAAYLLRSEQSAIFFRVLADTAKN